MSATGTTRLDSSSGSQTRYVGVADWWGRHVWVERGGTRTQLPYAKNPVVTFAWGRGGLGTRELARAILQHATEDTMLTERLSRALAQEIIAQLPELEFQLDRDAILRWLGHRGSEIAPSAASNT